MLTSTPTRSPLKPLLRDAGPAASPPPPPAARQQRTGHSWLSSGPTTRRAFLLACLAAAGLLLLPRLGLGGGGGGGSRGALLATPPPGGVAPLAWPPAGGAPPAAPPAGDGRPCVYAGAPSAPLRQARTCGDFARVTARYTRRSLTPALLLYEAAASGNATGAAPRPCALLKLSCRLRLSPGEGAAVTVHHAGTGHRQAAILDTAWGDALSQAALGAMADVAAAAGDAGAAAALRAATLPGGGVHVSGADALYAGWAAARAAARRGPEALPPSPVPATCLWPGGRLLGFASAFAPRLRQQRPSVRAFEAQGAGGRAALAVMVVMDAVTGSPDRGQGGKNMFVAAPPEGPGRRLAEGAARRAAGGGARARPAPLDYVALDFNDWRLDAAACDAASPRRPARALARLPNFWKPLVAPGADAIPCGEPTALATARDALRLAAAACGAGGAAGAPAFDFGAGAACAGFRARLAQRLLADPWFAAQAASPAVFADGTQCCEYEGGRPANGRPVVSHCGACCAGVPDAAARSICRALQAHIGAPCFAAHGARNTTDFLAALVAARLRDAGASLQEVLRECGARRGGG